LNDPHTWGTGHGQAGRQLRVDDSVTRRSYLSFARESGYQRDKTGLIMPFA